MRKRPPWLIGNGLLFWCYTVCALMFCKHWPRPNFEGLSKWCSAMSVHNYMFLCCGRVTTILSSQWPSNHGLGAILNRWEWICCICGQSDRTDKVLRAGQLFIQVLGGSCSPKQINQLRTSWNLDQPAQSHLIPSGRSINRAEIQHSMSVLTDHSFWRLLSFS